MASKRMREVIGAMLRGEVRKVGSHQIQRGVEDIAPAGNERAAKVGIDKVLLRNLPARPLARRLRAGLRRRISHRLRSLRAVRSAGPLAGGPQIKPLRQRKAGFIHVRGDVGGIEQQHIAGFAPIPPTYR